MNLSELMRMIAEDSSSNVEVHYTPKGTPGTLDDVITIDANDSVGKLAAMLGIPDGWKPTRVGNIWAAFNSGDRLTFFKNKGDFQADDEPEEE